MFNDSKLEVKFTEENNLLSGACVVLTESNYKITYKDMTFKGEFSQLTDSFLPCVIYSFIRSFENGILLDSYDEERACYFVKRDSNGCFVILECYETDENKVYSIEIK